MIPTAFLQAWSVKAPWPDLRQVEQDLIICRALCDLFNAPALAGKLAFRGGTAIHKLLFSQALRYSEDIDLVQTQPEPIGGTVDAIRAALSWLGRCNREQAGYSKRAFTGTRVPRKTRSPLTRSGSLSTAVQVVQSIIRVATSGRRARCGFGVIVVFLPWGCQATRRARVLTR